MRFIFFLLSMALMATATGQYRSLSESGQIMVVTCGPDDQELYAAFGHSAFRVRDDSLGIDHIYNYGIFDFDQPNFYLNFAKGFLYYKLGVSEYERFRNYYMYHGRFIHEQELNLDHEQKNRLFEFLQWNALPENQFYRYDYFYDNCATRIRDALETVFEDDLRFDFDFIDTDYSIRDLTDLYLGPFPWGDLGIDLCLGLPMDVKAEPRMYMFLPDYVEYSMANAYLLRAGKWQPLVKNHVVIYEGNPEIGQNVTFFKPYVVSGLLFLVVLILTAYGVKKKKYNRHIDFFFWFVTGFLGLFLLTLWLLTDHEAAAKNFNLLWALPHHLIFAFIWFKKQEPSWFVTYNKYLFIYLILLLISWVFLPQALPLSLMPIAGIMAFRAGYYFYFVGRINPNTKNI